MSESKSEVYCEKLAYTMKASAGHQYKLLGTGVLEART
jgi:hypothetical protein